MPPPTVHRTLSALASPIIKSTATAAVTSATLPTSSTLLAEPDGMVDTSLNNIPECGLNDPLSNWGLDRTPSHTLPKPSPNNVNPFETVASDLSNLDQEMLRLIDTKPTKLKEAAGYFWGNRSTGKKIRPTILFLISSSLPSSSVILPTQRRLACITEMIHTASLFHDDVIDNGQIRRGNKTANQQFGNKMAILGGDFLLAKASVSLARLRNLEVVELMSAVIEHLVRGEVMQIKGEGGIQGYLGKNFFKTSSLIANSSMSAAILGNAEEDVVRDSYLYGKYLGNAFQLVDDVLDFEGKVEILGKERYGDLKSGLATGPVLFAEEEKPEMKDLRLRKFTNEGDIQRALDIIYSTSAIDRTKDLARVNAEMAMDVVEGWGGERESLKELCRIVVDREK
mmetsp:Transcript_2862/g.5902  ORF Transcript_2862/g.5902 Transcript_2862/m.5902 type:complete len:397 (-) Transcript_2862:14-1204(-)